MTSVEAESKIAMIREELPAVNQYAYLNTGTFGPLPTRTVEAMARHQEVELTEGRIVASGFHRSFEIRTQARAEVAKVLGCSPANVALTRHTTDGMNIAVMGLNWAPGDEIIISDMEHPGGQGPVYNVARRYGVTVRIAHLGDGTGDVVGAFERLITPRTRMIVTSHLSWNTGTVLPLADIVDVAHRHHVLVAADAAQSAGSVPVNVVATGVDVYATPGQKWLCGPEGTGAVYVSDAAMEQIQQSVVGYVSFAAWEHVGAYFTPQHDATRYEVGGMTVAAVLGQQLSVSWITETVGLDWAYARIAQLGRYCWDALAALDGVTMLTPRDRMAGLVTFGIDGFEPPALVEALADRGVVIRWIDQPAALRVSTGFYNTEADIDRLVDALTEIQREGR